VHYPGFLTPGTIIWCLDAFRDCNGEVLVPTHSPVGYWRLVEQNAAHCEGTAAKKRIYEGADFVAVGEGGDCGDIEEVPKTATLTGGLWENSFESHELIMLKKRGDDRETGRCDLSYKRGHRAA